MIALFRKLFDSLSNFFKGGCIVTESYLATLFKVDIIVILGIVFANDKLATTINMAKVARGQYILDTLMLIWLQLIVTGVCSIVGGYQVDSGSVLTVTAIIACIGYSTCYAISAGVSRLIAYRHDMHASNQWCSHYYLDQLQYMYKLPADKGPLTHWRMLPKCFKPGTKFTKQGWYIKVC